MRVTRAEVLQEFVDASRLGFERVLRPGLGFHVARSRSDAEYFRQYRARHRERLKAQRRARRLAMSPERLDEVRAMVKDRTRKWRASVHASIDAIVVGHKLKSKWRNKL